MFSEKRTYVLKGELIFITKVRKDESQKFYWISLTLLSTGESFKLKDSELKGAVKTIDSTEFFVMWMHYINFKDKDDDYSVRHCLKVINTLKQRKIELHGSNKFEDYDKRHIAQMYNAAYSDGAYKIVYQDIKDLFNGGYDNDV